MVWTSQKVPSSRASIRFVKNVGRSLIDTVHLMFSWMMTVVLICFERARPVVGDFAILMVAGFGI
jgi:hypothetical protein